MTTEPKAITTILEKGPNYTAIDPNCILRITGAAAIMSGPEIKEGDLPADFEIIKQFPEEFDPSGGLTKPVMYYTLKPTDKAVFDGRKVTIKFKESSPWGPADLGQYGTLEIAMVPDLSKYTPDKSRPVLKNFMVVLVDDCTRENLKAALQAVKSEVVARGLQDQVASVEGDRDAGFYALRATDAGAELFRAQSQAFKLVVPTGTYSMAIVELKEDSEAKTEESSMDRARRVRAEIRKLIADKNLSDQLVSLSQSSGCEAMVVAIGTPAAFEVVQAHPEVGRVIVVG